MNCESTIIIYFITCMKYLEQYVGSATKFKEQTRVYKPDIKIKKDRYETVRHFNNKCFHSSNASVYLHVQLIEKEYCIYDDCNIEDILRDREEYWQSQLFTNVKGMNSISDLYQLEKTLIWLHLVYTISYLQLAFLGITVLRILTLSRRCLCIVGVICTTLWITLSAVLSGSTSLQIIFCEMCVEFSE